MIDSRTFSIVAALSPQGFFAHSIYEGGIGADEFTQFLNLLEPRMEAGRAWGIIDNAAIHLTDAVRIRLEESFHACFTYCARYSPHLKPIERVFALVKEYIRYNEQRALQDPVGVISEAFELFCIGGPRAHVIHNFFNLYRRVRYNYAH